MLLGRTAMRAILELVIALAVVETCIAVPSATKSKYLITDGAGVSWKRGVDTMNAFIDLRAQPVAPDVMYLEAVFPDPSRPGGQELVRTEFRKADGRVHIEGSQLSGWRNRKTYTYLIRVYTDSAYKEMLGVHEQQSVFYDPRGYVSKAPAPRPVAPTVVQAEIPERWVFSFDSREWQVGYQAGNSQRTIREYVLKGQTVENWTELVTSLYMADNVAPRALFEQFRKDLARDCPSLRTSIIEESADTIIFEWQHDGCRGFPAQHEIRRITRGRTGCLTLSFVEKTSQLTAEKRATWIAVLKAASVRPDV
jgi:hypothetical protein